MSFHEDELLEEPSTEDIDSSQVTIRNVSGTFVLSGAPFDLTFLAKNIWNTRYNPQQMKALIFRKTKPKADVLLFSSGNAVVIGAINIDTIEKVAKIVAKEVSRALKNQKISVLNTAVTNIFATGALGFSVNLGMLCEHRQAIKPDNYPGVIFGLKEPVKKVTVFQNGKLAFLGAKTIQDIEHALEIMKQLMKSYKVVPKQPRSRVEESETISE